MNKNLEIALELLIETGIKLPSIKVEDINKNVEGYSCKGAIVFNNKKRTAQRKIIYIAIDKKVLHSLSETIVTLVHECAHINYGKFDHDEEFTEYFEEELIKVLDLLFNKNGLELIKAKMKKTKKTIKRDSKHTKVKTKGKKTH